MIVLSKVHLESRGWSIHTKSNGDVLIQPEEHDQGAFADKAIACFEEKFEEVDHDIRASIVFEAIKSMMRHQLLVDIGNTPHAHLRKAARQDDY
jgi:hypothetical protein